LGTRVGVPKDKEQDDPRSKGWTNKRKEGRRKRERVNSPMKIKSYEGPCKGSVKSKS